MYFSKTTLCFYPETLLERYKEHGTLPDDLVAVSESCVDEYMRGMPPEGKVLGADKAGKPTWKAKPKPSKDQQEANERRWRNLELVRADTELKKAEDDDGVGTPQEWRAYRKSLRAWPEHEKFPNKAYRPKSPDSE